MKFDPSIDIEDCEEVYSPSDDTYLLLHHIEVEKGDQVLEMGCGTGLISLHCARAGAEVTAVDANIRAVECTRKNAERNGVSLEVVHSYLFDEVEGKFDLVIFNPPYLPVKEEGLLEMSWSGGEGGTEVVEEFLKDLKGYIRRSGESVILLSSKMDQKKVDQILSAFNTEVLDSKRLFFEELSVVRLIIDS